METVEDLMIGKETDAQIVVGKALMKGVLDRGEDRGGRREEGGGRSEE
jgi:hypothetical protein